MAIDFYKKGSIIAVTYKGHMFAKIIYFYKYSNAKISNVLN